MTKQDNQTASVSSIKERAEKAIKKGREDALEQKLKDLLKKRAEHERAINQLDTEIEQAIEAHEKGL